MSLLWRTPSLIRETKQFICECAKIHAMLDPAQDERAGDGTAVTVDSPHSQAESKHDLLVCFWKRI